MRKISGGINYATLQNRIYTVIPGSYVEGNDCFRDVSFPGPVPSRTLLLSRSFQQIFQCVRGRKRIYSYFDHQTFTPTVDRLEPKFLNCIPALFTLATFHMIKLSSTGLVRLYCGEVCAEKFSPATKGLLKE